MTKVFLWIEERLDKGAWFRRGYVIAASILVWEVTLWAMGFAASSPRPGGEVAMIIATVVGAPSALTTFAFAQYLNSRNA